MFRVIIEKDKKEMKIETGAKVLLAKKVKDMDIRVAQCMRHMEKKKMNLQEIKNHQDHHPFNINWPMT